MAPEKLFSTINNIVICGPYHPAVGIQYQFDTLYFHAVGTAIELQSQLLKLCLIWWFGKFEVFGIATLILSAP